MCDHKRVKSVNGIVSCIDCGEVLPDYFKTAVNRQKQAENTPVDAGKYKAPAKKKTAQKVK